MSIHAKDSTITFKWVILPTASPLAKADFDVELTLPTGVTTYTDDGILTYVAPTATAQGSATYELTPALTGRYRISLMVGANLAFVVHSIRQIYVVEIPEYVLNGVSGNTLHGPAILPQYLVAVVTTLDVSAQIDGISAPTRHLVGSAVKPDGLKVYVSDTRGTLYQYTLSTAWDFTNATYNSSVLIAEVALGADMMIFFDSTGTRFYACAVNSRIYEYTLSIPWDLSTITYTGNSFIMSEFGAYQTIGFSVNSTGTRIYALKAAPVGATVYQYNMSAWDLSTIVYNDFYTTAVTDNYSYGLGLDPDDATFHIGDNDSDAVHEFVMGTPGDITTSSSTGTSQSIITPSMTGLRGVSIAPDGTLLVSNNTTPYMLSRFATIVQ